MQIAFDKRISSEMAPLLLHWLQVSTLREKWLNKPPIETYYRLKNEPVYCESQIASITVGISRLVQAYKKSLEECFRMLDKAISLLKKGGITVDNKRRKAAREFIENSTLHVGEQSAIANRALVHHLIELIVTESTVNPKIPFYFPKKPLELVMNPVLSIRVFVENLMLAK